MCGRFVVTDQAHITESIKRVGLEKRQQTKEYFQVDATSVTLTKSLIDKKKAHSKFLEELGQLSSLNDEIVKIQVISSVF